MVMILMLMLVYTGVCFTVPLVAGRIADMIAGRFNTIFASFLILFVGNNLSYGTVLYHDKLMMMTRNRGCRQLRHIISQNSNELN